MERRTAAPLDHGRVSNRASFGTGVGWAARVQCGQPIPCHAGLSVLPSSRVRDARALALLVILLISLGDYSRPSPRRGEPAQPEVRFFPVAPSPTRSQFAFCSTGSGAGNARVSPKCRFRDRGQKHQRCIGAYGQPRRLLDVAVTSPPRLQGVSSTSPRSRSVRLAPASTFPLAGWGGGASHHASVKGRRDPPSPARRPAPFTDALGRLVGMSNLSPHTQVPGSGAFARSGAVEPASNAPSKSTRSVHQRPRQDGWHVRR